MFKILKILWNCNTILSAVLSLDKMQEYITYSVHSSVDWGTHLGISDPRSTTKPSWKSSSTLLPIHACQRTEQYTVQVLKLKVCTLLCIILYYLWRYFTPLCICACVCARVCVYKHTTVIIPPNIVHNRRVCKVPHMHCVLCLQGIHKY